MASTLSSLSSVLGQPHCGLRLKKLHSRCRLSLGFLSPLKPQASVGSCFHHRVPLPLKTTFPFGPSSRSFSQKSICLPEGPFLQHFIAQAALTASSEAQPDQLPASKVTLSGRIYHETYGCQMNINDMEIVLSIMKNAGYSEVVDDPESAELIFINTCAIRDNAEQRVWQRLNYFWFLKREWKSNVKIGRSNSLHPPKVVVLGCMAERLKDKILDADKMVDVVCGPDAYRDLPRLLEERQGAVTSCRVYSEGGGGALERRCEREFPEMRFRYTSPHPKDFPDELLYLMRDRHNICKCIHLPAQTGNSKVLERMRRGYTREAYLDLVQKIRRIIPDAGITSDFICGFCGETEEEHADTLSLIKIVGYDMAYMFAYSMREKTHAHRNYIDDVPEEIKQRRLTELIDAFRESTGQCYDSQIGTVQLVLVEGPNKRAPDTELIGKSDRGHRVSFINLPVPYCDDNTNGKRNPVVGDYVEVHILKSTRATLFGEALAITKLSSFYNNMVEEAVACESRS
ncbi:hypothetical protein CIPAW_07G053500 [Carya illinoinensis]|uniref:CDK5RAP1-like protein n=1 Tax=Carya illinoinensis TaxID=32201 RepID=A0A8T1PV61_CARIL|nr:hypothetical protein CIPAW_07G053500 [Carya illinoinensis]